MDVATLLISDYAAGLPSETRVLLMREMLEMPAKYKMIALKQASRHKLVDEPKLNAANQA